MSGKSFFSLNFTDGSSLLDNSNNELLTFDVSGNATNNLEITNNAAGSNVTIKVIGNDDSIGLNLNTKADGQVNVLASSNGAGIRLYNGETSSDNFIGLKSSSSLAKDLTFTLPTSDGTSGQVLQTDGSGLLSFTDSGSGSPGGANTQIQFNDNGAFGGLSTVTTDGTDLTLTSGTELRFGDAGENIVGDGSDLYVNSSQSLVLAPTANVMVGSGVSVDFGDAGENIVGDGSDLYVNSSQSLVLAPTANVMVGSGVSIDFGDAGENIVGDGADLYVNSSQSLVLAPTANVMVGSGVSVDFGDAGENIQGNGSNLTINSSQDINLVPAGAGTVVVHNPISLNPDKHDSAQVYYSVPDPINGYNANIGIQGSNSGLVLNMSGNTYITTSHLILPHEIVNSAPATYWPKYNITLFNLSSGTSDTVDVSGNPVDQGASWHVLFDNTGDTDTSLIIDFGVNGLVSGSGLAQNLTFSTTGQSASLIYMAEKWRIINTGAVVS
jgi:hypothetical protein